MEVICNKCGYVVNKDKYIKGKLIEEYKNIYGTVCPKCGNIIKSFKNNILEENNLKIELLKN